VTKIIPALLAGLLSAGLASGAEGAAARGQGKALPYGHKDFVPTPERPIYFRAGNGEYPGATPPMEWWDGTPIQRDGKVRNHWTHQLEPARGKLWDFADRQSKNILWKVPVPGWSLSHPIVVGTRVFAIGEPDFVTGWDADTGKVLWQRRVMPLLLDGLPEEKARAGQKVLDLARALFYVSASGPTAGQQPGNLFNFGLGKEGEPLEKDERTFVAGKRAVAGKLAKMVASHRQDVAAFGDADLLAAADADLAILRRIEAAQDAATMLPLLTDRKGRSLNLHTACERKLGVQIGGCWWGYVGTADSTLASDGKRIYGVFDQGQVFCYDLDGNLVWGHREKGRHDNRGCFHRSPILRGDLLLVRSREVRKGTGRLMRAYDTATGELRWESPLAGSNYTVPRLMRLAAPGGAAVDVLVGDAPASAELGQEVLRVGDGRLLGHLPRQDCGRGALMSVWGDILTWGSTSDGGGGPSCSYRVRLAGPQAVAAEPLFVQEEKSERIFYNIASFPTMLGGLRISGGRKGRGFSIYDVRDAKEVGSAPERLGEYAGPVVAGQYLIAIAHPPGGHAHEALHGRDRDDQKALARFVVADLRDPSKPKVVSSRNLLGYKDPPADIIVKNYLSDFDPYDFADCYAGSPCFFALMGGPVPHGSRLFVQSTAFLYCIGEPSEARR
jgi:hypothetical protein